MATKLYATFFCTMFSHHISHAMVIFLRPRGFLPISTEKFYATKPDAAEIPSILDQEPIYHIPVMAKECCEYLLKYANGVYVDCTLGGGGHTKAMLEKGCNVIGIDQDPDAISEASTKLSNYLEQGKLEIVRSNFRYLPEILKNSILANGQPVDGVLLDLGVSSHQINNPERGFSFAADGPLDMRMGKGVAPSNDNNIAAAIINEWDGTRLANILYEYGEEPRSKVIAREIVASRPLNSTAELVDVISRNTYWKNRSKTLARCFQALRIVVNDELGALDEFLSRVHECVRPGGRIVVLSYHSLEDRRIKRLIKGSGNSDNDRDMDRMLKTIPMDDTRYWVPVVKRALLPSEEEISINRRSRSAKLRVGELVVRNETESITQDKPVRTLGAKELRKLARRNLESNADGGS